MEEKNTAISTAASDSAEMNENSQTSLKSKKTSEKRAVSPFGKEILKVRFAVYAKKRATYNGGLHVGYCCYEGAK